MSSIRILIADDHEVVRRGLALVLRQEADFVVVGEAEDGATAVSLAAAAAPHLALLDWKMPGMDGLQAARRIRAENPACRTLLLSGAPVDTAVLQALEAGVDGFVNKDISPADLAHAIRVVAGGRRYLGPEVAQALVAHNQSGARGPAGRFELSDREQEVLNLMASPATYREIGERLFIGEETVRTYVKRILTKLDQPNRTQAVLAALRAGLISLDS